MMISRFVALLLLVPVAAFAANSEWEPSHAIDMFQTQSTGEEIKNELELRENLEVVDREILRRIEIKRALVADLIAGRTNLAAVTEQFFVLNQAYPECTLVIRSSFSGSNDVEKTAHNVIGYVTCELTSYPGEQQAEVLARLNAELECLTCTGSATN